MGQHCEVAGEVWKADNANAICSPALIPERWNADYYTQAAMSYDLLRAQLGGSSVRSMLTVCVSLSELGDPNNAFGLHRRYHKTRRVITTLWRSLMLSHAASFEMRKTFVA